MANRFAKVIPGSTYIPHPYEEMFKVGLLKDQGIQNIIDKGQDFIDRSNYNTVFNPDTEYKISKVNSLVQSMNEAAKTNLDDPVNANKLRSVTNQFTNDHKVYDAIQRTNAFEQYQKNVKELGKDYRDQNALEYLDAIKRFNAGDQSAGEILKTAPSIDPYKDWEGEFINGLEKLKADKTITGFGSNYLTTTEGVTPERVNQLLLNGLSSESYQQMQKDYQYEKYTGMTDKDWEGWVTDKAITKGQIYSYTQQDAKYSGDANAQARLRLVQSQIKSNELGTPTSVAGQVNSTDLRAAVMKKYNTSGGTKTNEIYTPFGKVTSSTPDLNYKVMINDFKIQAGKSVYNLIHRLNSEGLSKDDINSKVSQILIQHGLGIKYENGKPIIIGDDKNIENFVMGALTNASTSVTSAYTIPNFTPESARLWLAKARNREVTVSVNGSSPTESAEALNTLLNDVSASTSILTSVSPNSQFGGKPTLRISTEPKITADGIIPGKTYDIGLDDYSQAIFGGNTNVFNAATNVELDTPIPITLKSKFKLEGSDNIYQYDHAVNSYEINDNGELYLNTNVVFYDINDTEKKNPYYEDYNKYTEEEVLPQFMNAPWNTQYMKSNNTKGFQNVGVLDILDNPE